MDREEVQKTILVHLSKSYWSNKPYKMSEVNALYERTPSNAYLCRFDFTSGSGLAFSIKSVPPNTLTQFTFEHIVRLRQYIDKLNGSFLISLGDGVHEPMNSGGPSNVVPLFGFCKHIDDPVTPLLPDPNFVGSYGELDFSEWTKLEKQITPWEKKKPIIFWRGSTTGHMMITEDWKNSPRAKLIALSKLPEIASKMDVYFSGKTQITDQSVLNAMEELGYFKVHVEFKQFYQFRYLLEVDGNSCPWSFLKKLRMNSLVLKVESPYMQWYYPVFKPWEHYVPIKADLSDLNYIVDWVYSNDKKAQEIADRGALLASYFDLDLAERYSFAKVCEAISGFINDT